MPVKLVAESGIPRVDEDGFVALVDATYDGYIDVDWTLPQILERFARERRAERAVIAFPGPDLAGSPLGLVAAPAGRERVIRSFQAPLTVTGGRVWLCDYTQLTMAAQYEDEPAMNSSTPWIAVENGRYLVTVQEVRTPLRHSHRMHVGLDRLEPDSGSGDPMDAATMLVPWFDAPIEPDAV